MESWAKIAWLGLSAALLAVLGGVLAIPPGEPDDAPAPVPPFPPPVVSTRPLPSPDEIAAPHLSWIEQQSDKAIDTHLHGLDLFFTDARQNTRQFAAEALGWRSKMRLVADYVPFTRKDRHPRFLRAKFEELIFTPAALEQAIRQAVSGYLAQVESDESVMLVRLRQDVAEFPTAFVLASVGSEQLQSAFDAALTQAVAATGSSLSVDVARELVSLIAGEVLAQVAVRLGVSAGVLGAGAATSWATLGLGLVVGVIVDQIVSWVWNWLADPVGDLAQSLNRKLNELHRLIVQGDGDVQGLRERLRQFARERAQVRRAAVLQLLQPPGGVAK